MYSPGQLFFLQFLLSTEFPPQLLPNTHLLRRISVPVPHVTEQVHLDQDDQATNKALSNKVVNILYILSI